MILVPQLRLAALAEKRLAKRPGINGGRMRAGRVSRYQSERVNSCYYADADPSPAPCGVPQEADEELSRHVTRRSSCLHSNAALVSEHREAAQDFKETFALAFASAQVSGAIAQYANMSRPSLPGTGKTSTTRASAPVASVVSMIRRQGRDTLTLAQLRQRYLPSGHSESFRVTTLQPQHLVPSW